MATKNLAEKAYDPDWLKGTSAESSATSKAAAAGKRLLPPYKKKQDFSNPVYKQLSKINGKINKMTMEDLVSSLRNLELESGGNKEVLAKRLKAHHKKQSLAKTTPRSGEEACAECKFDFVCVIDFEATCTESKVENYPHEIIEFPLVLVNMKTLNIDDSISFYCRPVINQRLTQFCTQLTGITQEQVDRAEEFGTVLKSVQNWLDERGLLGSDFKFAAATDGPWDMQNFLNLQCFQSGVSYPRWARKWIDVRKLFSNWFGVKRCNIEKMLGYCGLDFEGQQHCGLDDAKNIARILIRLAKDGCQVRVNANIKDCLSQIGEGREIDNVSGCSDDEDNMNTAETRDLEEKQNG